MDAAHYSIKDAYRQVLKEDGEVVAGATVPPPDAMSAGPLLQDFKDNPKTSTYYPFNAFHKEKGHRKMFKRQEPMNLFLKNNPLWAPVLDKDEEHTDADDATNETPDGNEGEA
jgi:hypothetical protein